MRCKYLVSSVYCGVGMKGYFIFSQQFLIGQLVHQVQKRYICMMSLVTGQSIIHYIPSQPHSLTVEPHRGKEMSLSCFLGVYYKLPISDPNAVYLLPNAVFLLQCCFIAANIVWAGQCDNSLFPWKLYKINWTAL